MEGESPWPLQTLPPACYPCAGTRSLAAETPAEEGGKIKEEEKMGEREGKEGAGVRFIARLPSVT